MEHCCLIRWMFLFLVLVVLSATLVVRGWNENFTGFEAALIGVNLTVAVLAINFSSLTYQASEYRQFQRGLSPNLLLGFLVVLVWALVPAMILVFDRRLLGVLSLAALPVTALLSVVLVEWTKYEASPHSLIRQLSRVRRWRKEFRAYAREIEKRKQELKALKLSEPGNMPAHEWDWVNLPPVPENDPFTILGSVGCTAAKSGNASAVVQASESLLKALDECYAEIRPSQNHLPAQTASLVESQVERIALVSEYVDSTGNLSIRFLETCGNYLTGKTKEHLPLASSWMFVVDTIVASGQRWLARKKPLPAKPALILLSQLCRKGMERYAAMERDESDERFESLFYPHTLGGLVARLKPLGSTAVEAGENDYLYRIFDALGWLGCSAAKSNNWIVAAECIQALAQLGREARAQGLECHWESCAVQPADHAGERIGWIVSWIPKLSEKDRSSWLELCSQGLSRLEGRTHNIILKRKDNRSELQINVSDSPHKESFLSDAGSRELDYSNFKMLKDFKLHGHMGGTVVQGPPVPMEVEPGSQSAAKVKDEVEPAC